MAIPGQDEPLAEKQFKHIESFKGAKASDVIPAMEFMSASLGVGCDYCHTEDKSSEEKEAKHTAREMIAMQRDINNKNFRGRNQVTCATCHAGHARPVAVPPVEGAGVRTQRSQSVKADEVLSAFGKAAGAADPGTSSGLRLTGTNLNHGEKGKVEALYAGGKFTYTIQGAKTENRFGFTGSDAWFTTPGGIQRVPLVYATQYLRQYTLFTTPDSLPKLTNPNGGTTKLAGRDLVVLSGTIAADKTRVSLYFDKKSGLLARTLFGYPTVLGTIIQTNDYTDYRKVGGVQVPMTITNHTAEGDTVTSFKSAKLDSKIDPSAFEPPKK